MKKNKFIAPVVITVLFLCYCALYGFLVLYTDMPIAAKAIFTVVLIGMAVTMVAVLVERIKEIRKGEYDDISKY